MEIFIQRNYVCTFATESLLDFVGCSVVFCHVVEWLVASSLFLQMRKAQCLLNNENSSLHFSLFCLTLGSIREPCKCTSSRPSTSLSLPRTLVFNITFGPRIPPSLANIQQLWVLKWIYLLPRGIFSIRFTEEKNTTKPWIKNDFLPKEYKQFTLSSQKYQWMIWTIW